MVEDYLQHSSKGTSWRKKEHDFTRRQGKRYYYAYEAAQKKAWRLKQKMKANAVASEGDRNARNKAQGNADVASIYRDSADMASALGAHESARKMRTSAQEYERRANDYKPKHTKPNKALNAVSDGANRAKRYIHRQYKSISKSAISKGKALVNKWLNGG